MNFFFSYEKNFKKRINFYLTFLTSIFLLIVFVLILVVLFGYVFAIFSIVFIKFMFRVILILLLISAILRSLAIIVLEGFSSWLFGLKVLIQDFLFVLFRPKLWKLGLISFYFPYHLARQDLEKLDLKKLGLEVNDLIYGETPYFSIAKIIKEIRPGAGEELFVDLGCGIGKVVFFMSLYFNLPAEGIEINPALFRAAIKIKEILKIEKVNFLNQNILDADFSEGTIFYVHGTSWHEELYKKLVEKFFEIKPGALVLSVSHPIEIDYLKLVKELKIDLNWGREPLYIYQRVV